MHVEQTRFSTVLISSIAVVMLSHHQAHEWLAVRVLENFYVRHRRHTAAALDPTLQERIQKLEALWNDKAKKVRQTKEKKLGMFGRLKRRFMQVCHCHWPSTCATMSPCALAVTCTASCRPPRPPPGPPRSVLRVRNIAVRRSCC